MRCSVIYAIEVYEMFASIFGKKEWHLLNIIRDNFPYLDKEKLRVFTSMMVEKTKIIGN